MPRPISWQTRLNEIHRLVSESPRDPYHRADLEKLFRVGDRAAQKLLALLPKQTIGSSLVVERVDLLEFLGQATDAEDLGRFLAELRSNPPKPRRRKLRFHIPRDFQPGVLSKLSRDIWLRRGEVTIHFGTLEELARRIYDLLTVLELPEFERRVALELPTPAALEGRVEMNELLADLEELEAEHARRNGSPG